MRTLLVGELAFCVALVIGCVATLDRPFTSIRAWIIVASAGMFIWFIGEQVTTLDNFWLGFLAIAVGLKAIGLVLLIQDRTARSRRIKLEAVADANQRDFVSVFSHLCHDLDSGRTESDSAEIPAPATGGFPFP